MAKALQPVENQTAKKTVIRSPKYPLLTLQSALTKAKVIYGYEKRVKTTIAVVLSHLGYSTQVGLPARVLSALLQYGLLEKAGDKVGISERAFRIFNLPEDSDERESLIREAALKPALFKELVNEYPTGLPSDAALKSYLIINKAFNENRIGEFFKVFKAAIDLAKPFDGDYTGEQQSQEEEAEGEQEQVMDSSTPTVQRQGHKPPPPAVPAGHKDFPLYLSQSQKAVLYIPAAMSRKDYELLKKQIEHSLSIIEATSLVSETDD